MTSQLKDSEDWNNIFITPDLSLKERQLRRKLRAELAERREKGEKDLVIKGSRIVKLSPRASKATDGSQEDPSLSRERVTTENITQSTPEQVNKRPVEQTAHASDCPPVQRITEQANKNPDVQTSHASDCPPVQRTTEGHPHAGDAHNC